ncbi:MAG: TSUP family transporter [Thermoplasmatota archaeon]
MDPWTLAALVAAGFLASFIDAIVGGGGAISLPALLAAGLPPHVALGTNKLAGTGSSAMATLQYLRAGQVVPRVALHLLPWSLVGGLLGAVTVLNVPAGFVRGLVLALIVALVGYVLAKPRFGEQDQFRIVTPRLAIGGAALAFAIGFYDGFLGPGTGSFLLFVFVALHGFGFLRAAAHGRVLNFGSNIAALLFFLAVGQVDFEAGLPMMAATMVGATVGSRFAICHGDRWVKVLFVVMAGVLAVRLLMG